MINCPKCKSPISPDDCEWSGGSTEDGTDFFTVEITCSKCGWSLEREGWGCPESLQDKTDKLDGIMDEYMNEASWERKRNE